jgi:hypothetical protein
MDHVSTQAPGSDAEPHDSLVRSLLARADDGLPVLRVTAQEIARIGSEQEHLSGNALAAAILRDPLMTLRVLRFLYSHRTRSQTVDITTMAHAIIMLGHARFFREFQDLPVIEAHLHGDAAATVRALISRSRLAALFARDWALQRHDIDPEEVMVASLLHDMPELLLELTARPESPAGAVTPEHRAQLFARLQIPGLVAELNGEEPAHSIRVLNVRLACELARHCHAGWQAEAIAADLAEVQRFLRTSAPQAWERVRKVVLLAAREWHYYGSPPAAASMPFIAD